VPDRDPNVFWAAAQIRPTTGPMALADDVVGDVIAEAPEHLVSTAYLSREIAADPFVGLGRACHAEHVVIAANRNQADAWSRHEC
jgi:hypothetical protein